MTTPTDAAMNSKKDKIQKTYLRLKITYFAQLFFLIAPFFIEFSPLKGFIPESAYFPYTITANLVFSVAFLFYFGRFAKLLGENPVVWVFSTLMIWQFSFLLSIIRARSIVKNNI